eukprot:m.247536 g.247536  ORF g.247536 m.247536 type:complete len:260 (+) comp17486_c0_seq3:4933-5712(+)
MVPTVRLANAVNSCILPSRLMSCVCICCVALKELRRPCTHNFQCKPERYHFSIPSSDRCTRCRSLAVVRTLPALAWSMMSNLIQTTANKAVRTAHVYGDSLRRSSSAATQPATAEHVDSPVAVDLPTPTSDLSELTPTSLTPATMVPPSTTYSPLLGATSVQDTALLQQLAQLQQVQQLQSALNPSLATSMTPSQSTTNLLGLLLGSSLPSEGGSPSLSTAAQAHTQAPQAATPAPTASMLQLLQALGSQMPPPATTSK